MSLLNKFKTNSYCAGGRHYSGTVNIRGAITSKGTKMLNFFKMLDFFKSVAKATVNFGKKVANNPERALELASKIGSAAESRNPKAALAATPDINKFATTGEGIKVVQKGRGLYLGTKKR